MFTGLIQDVGTVKALRSEGLGSALEISTVLSDSTFAVGHSLAVDGACLTAVEVRAGWVKVEAVAETLKRTTLSRLVPGGRVNLERPLRVGDRLDGHWVLGHVDAVGRIRSVKPVGRSRVIRVEAPGTVMRYVVEKGSVAVDGISLTVSAVHADAFEVTLVPHTLEKTTLGSKGPSDPVNLEADVLGKYVERLLADRNKEPAADGQVTAETLRAHGFLES